MGHVLDLNANVDSLWGQSPRLGDDNVDGVALTQSFGELIRFYRRRLRQIHNGQPWSQEDLAVAIGSDKSHVNRIERGHQRPCPETLQRICDALELSWPERSRLMSLAGQTLAPPSPTPSEVAAAVQYAGPFLHTFAHPAVLLDVEGRLWDMNDLHAYAFYGYRGRDVCMVDLYGARSIEQLLNPRIETWLRQVIVDYDAYFRRQVTRFWHVFRDRQQRPEYQAILKRLLSVDALRSVWLELCANPNEPKLSPFINHQLLTVRNPCLGRYTVQVWHSVFAFDDRFILVQHVPADVASRELFTNLTARFDRAAPPPARMAVRQAVLMPSP